MGKREIVRESLYSYGYSDDILCMTIPQAVEWLQGLLADVPDEFREESTFYLGLERGSYDESDMLNFDIYYERPETDAEMVKREADEAAYRARSRAEQEARERREFERLKEKFG